MKPENKINAFNAVSLFTDRSPLETSTRLTNFTLLSPFNSSTSRHHRIKLKFNTLTIRLPNLSQLAPMRSSNNKYTII